MKNSRLISEWQSYNIGLIFLKRLWSLIENKLFNMHQDMYNAHVLFFGTICYEAESYEEWAEAMYQILQSQGKYNHDINQFFRDLFDIKKTQYRNKAEKYISEKDVFLMVIEFCKIYCAQYDLKFAVDYLTAMNLNPQDFKIEWEIWENVVNDVIKKRKYICSLFFWNFTIRLGRFQEYNDESKDAMSTLFSNKENLIASSKCSIDTKDVYLKNLSDDKQLWGYVVTKSIRESHNNQIADFGINTDSQNFLRGWISDPFHENGGYLGARIRYDNNCQEK